MPAKAPRIAALVIADPLSFFPDAESLQAVTVPMQLWGSERGGDGVRPEDTAAIARLLPRPPEFHVVPNSAHFVFLPPCPPALLKEVPAICTDDSGFDRAAFHADFNARVLAFFREHLKAGPAR